MLIQDVTEMKNKKTDGLKFAVTLLAAFGTIIFTAYNYFQNTTVDIFWYALVSGVIDVVIILSTLLIVYVLIKGILMEFPDCDLKDSIEKYISGFYLLSFIATIETLIIILGAFFLIRNWTNLFIVGILVSFMVTFLIVRYVINIDQNSSYIGGIVIGSLSLLLVSVIFWVPLFDIVLKSPLQGDVTIDIDSIYYRNDTPIPLSIQITGPNSGIRIFLYNKERNSYFLTDHIYLESRHTLNTTKYGSNSILFGNSMENGKFNVFIKSRQLPEGYYELICERTYDNKKSVESFYLLNTS